MLGSTIQRELAMFIIKEMNDPRVPKIVSITRVQLTSDLEYADVYISVMGTPGQQSAALNALKHSAGLMRSRLTRDLSLRQAPFLRFQFDEQLKKEMAVLDVLDIVRAENEALDRKRALAAIAAEELGGRSEGDESIAPPEPVPVEGLNLSAGPTHVTEVVGAPIDADTAP